VLVRGVAACRRRSSRRPGTRRYRRRAACGAPAVLVRSSVTSSRVRSHAAVEQRAVHLPNYTDHITRCILHGSYYTVHITRCTLHGAYYTVHITRCILHGAYYTVHITRCILHGAYHTVHITRCRRAACGAPAILGIRTCRT
jgi:hypothetical protein